IADLEKVPLKEIEYKGKVFYELDVEGIIKRGPQVVVVDELAHSNIPGSTNKKRYMDVQELLDAGISVLSAFNIQHLESVH
ncbi:histidine kinase, partial [Bacillus thuringiensis]